MGGIHKFSFHTPSSCRRAFTKEYSETKIPGNRVMQQWHRGPTPSKGVGKVVRVLRIVISTDDLSTGLLDSILGTIHWVNPAPTGGSTCVDLMFSNEPEEELRKLLSGEPENLQHNLHFYNRLPNGEVLVLNSFHSSHSQRVMRVAAAPHDPRDLIVLPEDPENTGRPVRLSLFSNPKDGDFITVWEMGGYWHSPLSQEEWNAMSEPYG